MKVNIGLSDNARKTVVDALSGVLADTYTLYLKTHNFHWNVTGPSFPFLHTMFEGQYTELAGAVDELAERIRALGHPAPGSYAAFSKLTNLKEAPASPPPAKEMIRQLLADNEAIARKAREVQETVEGVGDTESGDMMVGRLHVHGKAAWMLRVQLEG
jgi:starvation-inducible DNA-binding protein